MANWATNDDDIERAAAALKATHRKLLPEGAHQR
ncbi:hypothetical protein ABIE67_009141 [Streptomyces sp. V4I8]